MTDKRTAWTVMLVAFLAGVAAAVNQFKVPPVLPSLLPALGLNMAAGGWLMSITAVAALVLSIPAALSLNRVGLKRAGLAGLSLIVAGALAGALAGDATALFAARLLEGAGMCLVAIVPPAIISLWFAPHERGLPMGIWAAWVPVGSVIMFTLAPILLAALGWQSVWLFGALFALVALVLFALLVRLPAGPVEDRNPGPRPAQATEPAGNPAGPPVAARSSPGPAAVRLSLADRGLFNPASWLLALTFGAFVFGQLGYSTWAPVYLTDVLGMPAARASFYTGLLFMSGIAANLSAGWVINHMRHRPALPVLGMAATTILFAWCFGLSSAAVAAIYMLAMGLVSNVIPTSIFTLAPEAAKRPESVGLAMGAINVVSNLGILLGPPILGAVVAGGNWTAGSTLLVAASAAGVLASLAAWWAMRRG